MQARHYVSVGITTLGLTSSLLVAAAMPSYATTYSETTGGVTHTWTNYTNAGGAEGPTISPYTTVQIACKRPGFRVADGNTSWYRIASPPWNYTFNASADAFYNNGQTAAAFAAPRSLTRRCQTAAQTLRERAMLGLIIHVHEGSDAGRRTLLAGSPSM